MKNLPWLFFLTLCCNNLQTLYLFYSQLQAFLLQHFISFLPDLFRIATLPVGPLPHDSISCGRPPLSMTQAQLAVRSAFLQCGGQLKSSWPPCYCWRKAVWYLDLCMHCILSDINTNNYCVCPVYVFLCSRCLLTTCVGLTSKYTTLILLKETWDHLLQSCVTYSSV
jgi:hypothetical protein